MIGRVSVLVPPAAEPLSLDEALQHCRADKDIENEWFEDAIASAREDAEDYLRRAIIKQTLQLTFDGFPELPVKLPRSPVISVDSITAYDIDNTATTIALTNFIVDTKPSPAIITNVEDYTWPDIELRDLNSFVIQYTAGYASSAAGVPKFIKNAMKIHVCHFYENRAGETDLPDAFKNLLAKKRLYL
jgi:uncharacterized phiE125 gp8 family phage protein